MDRLRPQKSRKVLMTQRTLGVVMNGVTGRMGTNQHLIRSIAAIRAQGGVRMSDGNRVMPDPVLVGRNADKVAALAKAHGVVRWTHRPRRRDRQPATTRSSSMRRPRDARPACWRRRSPPASTSTARSRSPTDLEAALEICRLAKSRASSTAWCRTSCSCPAC